jgi:hypothetical protein
VPHRIVESIKPLKFDRIYGCWPQSLIRTGAKQAVLDSAKRYIQHIAT